MADAEEKDGGPSYIKPAVLTAILSIGIGLIIGLGTNKEIADNWSKYRCQPHIMPFASLYGYDAHENMEYCMKTVFLKEAPGVLAPIYEASSSLNESMSAAGDGLMSVRKSVTSLTNGIQSTVNTFNKRIEVVLQTFKGKFDNLKNMMGRVFAIFFAVMYMGISALAAGSTFAKGAVFGFLDAFCFPAGTPILCADGSYKPIEHLKMGDLLGTAGLEENRVTSTFQFIGSSTAMCRINDITISKNHFVQYEGHWIPAGEHPAMKSAPSYERLYCLNTSLHRFWAGRLLVSDFEESEAISSDVQLAVEKQLNGFVAEGSGNKRGDYSLGLDPHLEIETKAGWQPLHSIKLGADLKGGRVFGIVHELVPEITMLEDTTRIVSAGQLVWNPVKKQWTRGHRQSIKRETALIQLLTSASVLYIRDPDSKKEFAVRDYFEVADPSLEDLYEDALKIEPYRLTLVK